MLQFGFISQVQKRLTYMIEYRHGAAVCTQRIKINKLHVLNIKSTPVVLVETQVEM